MHEPATHATRSVEVWAGMEVCEELHGNVVQFSSVSKGEKLHCEMVKFVTSPLFLSERMKYNKLSFAQISTRGGISMGTTIVHSVTNIGLGTLAGEP